MAKNNASNSEFITYYDVYRKDRPDGYGGVLIAVKRDLISQNLPIASNCETVA